MKLLIFIKRVYGIWLTELISKLLLMRQKEKALKYGNYKQIYKGEDNLKFCQR